MKILYGVQGTGHGHISRAQAMASALARYPDLAVTYLISGRPRQKIAEIPGTILWRRGMTFAVRGGRLDYLQTVRANNLLQMWREVKGLALDEYDQVIIDYEPVVAWAARRQGIATTGIAHQYAFQYPVPTRGGNPVSERIMRGFAPAATPVGLHFDHFGYPILPPIVDLGGSERTEPIPGKVVVYLPIEDQSAVIALLRKINNYDFHLYGPGLPYGDTCNVHTRPISRAGFRRDLVSAESVITNAGFELISECLALGIRVLARPLAGQVEQLSNAYALEKLGYAHVIPELDLHDIVDWLGHGEFVRVNYPPVHLHLAEWLARNRSMSVEDLAGCLWSLVKIERGTSCAGDKTQELDGSWMDDELVNAWRGG